MVQWLGFHPSKVEVGVRFTVAASILIVAFICDGCNGSARKSLPGPVLAAESWALLAFLLGLWRNNNVLRTIKVLAIRSHHGRIHFTTPLLIVTVVTVCQGQLTTIPLYDEVGTHRITFNFSIANVSVRDDGEKVKAARAVI